MLDSGKSPLDPVEQLHALATEAASQESQSLADAADFNRHYETIVRPYDAAWNIIGDELYSKDPVRIIRALERLAETGRTAGDDDWLKSLADDQSNTLGTPERAIALAVRAVVCGDHFDEAAAASLASLVGRDPHGAVERLRRPQKKKGGASKTQPVLDSAGTIQDAKRPGKMAPTGAQDEPDGPTGINQWRHAGILSTGRLNGKPYQVACFLFARLGRKVSFGDLHSEFWKDTPVGDDTIAKHGRIAANWFIQQTPPIPLDIPSRDGMICMERITTEE